jgi:hypothetical protein
MGGNGKPAVRRDRQPALWGGALYQSLQLGSEAACSAARACLCASSSGSS